MKYTELYAPVVIRPIPKKYRVLDLQTGEWVRLPLGPTNLSSGELFPDLTTRPATRLELSRFHSYWVSDSEDRYEFVEWEES